MTKNVFFNLSKQIPIITIFLLIFLQKINSKEVKKEKNFINCEKYCSKFDNICPQIYNEILPEMTNYILENKLIESGTKSIPIEISNAFFYKGLYEYYGIATDSSLPNLETGLLNFIISSYFGNPEANYRLFILFNSDLIFHIIYTEKFKSFLSSDKLLKLITETEFWKNFEFFYKYPNTNSTNEQTRHDLQKQIGYNFLYLSILKKYSPAILVGGVSYAYGIGVPQNCDTGTQFFKEVAFNNIGDKINNENIRGNFAYTRFKIEQYEQIENIYDNENQLSSLEKLLQYYSLLKEDTQIQKKKEVITEIGIRYFYGISVERDFHKAKEWFEKGEKYQIGQCYGYLGEIYLHGFGLRKEEIDYKKAMTYFNKALINGETSLSNSGLGYIYYYGLGTPKNKKEAYNCFLRGIRAAGNDANWEVSSLFYNMISLLIEDDPEDEKENDEESNSNNNNKNEINYDNLKDEIGSSSPSNDKAKIKVIDTNKNLDNKKDIDKKDIKDDKKIPKDFNLAYKYANYLTLKQVSYGTYILAMMNEYNINAKLFSCEENLAFFRFSSFCSMYSINRMNLARKLYENKKYRSSFLIMMELAYEGHEDSMVNVVALLANRQIFKDHDYQKYLLNYFIELNLHLENYDLFFLSLSAKFYTKEKNYEKAIDLYKLLINHAAGNDKKFYIAEGFFNLGIMENFGMGLTKNLTKSKNFFTKAEKYEISSHYPIFFVKLFNKINSILGNNDYNSTDLYVNSTNLNNTGNKWFLFGFKNLNLLSFSLSCVLIFYTFFFFNLKFQDSENNI